MDSKQFTPRPTFCEQLTALLIRNFTIKKRNPFQILSLIAIPVVLVIYSNVFNKLRKYEDISAINEPIGVGTNWFNTIEPDFRSNIWFISPQNYFTQNITREIKEILKIMRYPDSNQIHINNSFKSSEDIENYYLLNSNEVKFSIIFDERSNSKISYRIRMPFNDIPSDGVLKGNEANCRERPFDTESKKQCIEMKYYRSGFTFIQTVIDSTIIRIISPNITNSVIPFAKLSIYPKPSVIIDTKNFSIALSIAISLSFRLLLRTFISVLILEKRMKIKESMFLMGLRMTAYWFGWIIIEAIFVAILTLFLSILIFTFNLNYKCNPIIIFLLIFLYGLTIMGNSAILSCILHKEFIAIVITIILLILQILVQYLVIFQDLSVTTYCLLSFFSHIPLTLGLKSIIRETVGNDSYLGFSNLFDDPNFSVGFALLFLVFDCILYTFIAIYLDQVIPGEYGPKQNLLFCIDYRFYFSKKPKPIRSSIEEFESNSDIEEVPNELKRKNSINIIGITKKFKTQNTIAVNGISMSIYESQITALLGHNGAGKTTLINTLIGTIRPTKGTAYIYGYDIRNPTHMKILRSMFGICQQQSILFDELNAEEHLTFFGAMKGVKRKDLESEVKKLLVNVNLYENRTNLSKYLSGGQKRKLCIAIALIGNPKVIILDEPTSGLDVCTRRQIYTLLELYKKDRTIILTTHFMDEADVLSDRKAIISNGKLRCIGSSLFLKRRFGIGYHLTIAVENDQYLNSITSLVKYHVPNSQFKRFTGCEIHYILPQNESQHFPKLFKALEHDISGEDIVDIKSYGVFMTTLEEVFLKLEKKPKILKSNEPENKLSKIEKLFDFQSISDDKFEPSFMKSFKAFFYLRLKLAQNHLTTAVLSPILYIGIIYLSLIFVSHNSPIFSSNSNPKPLLLDHKIYNKYMTNAVLKIQNKSNKEISDFINAVTELGIKVELINGMTFGTLNNSYSAVIISELKKDDISWEWLFNDTYIHSLPILQNQLTNTFLRFMNKDTINKSVPSIQTYSHRFPKLEDKNKSLIENDSLLNLYVLLCLFMAIIEYAMIFGVDIVEERVNKLRDLLRICGMSFKCYWFTNLVFHAIIMFVNFIVLIVLTLFLLKPKFLEPTEARICFITLLLLSIPGLLLSTYCLFQIFDSSINAKIILPFIIVIITYTLIAIFSVIESLNKTCGQIYNIFFLFLIPYYTIAFGLMRILSIYPKHEKVMGENEINFSYFDFESHLILCFIASIFHIILYTLLLKISEIIKSGGNIFEELGFYSPEMSKLYIEPSPLEDEEVKRERIKVQNILKDSHEKKKPILLLHELHKKYWRSNFFRIFGQTNDIEVEVAINDLSLMVEKNNIFGLLGPNGAGKTSTIKIITREEKQTHGLVMINGQEVKSSISDIYKSIGYCPQYDTLWQEITLKQHLYLFAAIRGIPSKDIKSICDKYMSGLKITEHAEKRIKELSGGTKRKLCYIISLLGRPKLVLLDEPSTGMDPRAKRFLWKTILSIFNKNSDKSAVLTTHSMEEATALCTRLAILTKGIMRCIGSVQQLKNKYGAGYVLEIKWNQNNKDINCEKVKLLVSKIFMKTTIREEYDNRLIYDIPQESVKLLSEIFTSLENAKNSISGIEEYSFSQTSFEQVFVHFAKEEDDDE